MKKALLPILLALALLLAPLAYAEEPDWSTDKANELTANLYELISYEKFAEYFTGSKEIHAQIDAWKTAMEQPPVSVSGYDLPSAELLMQMAGVTDLSLPDVMAEYVESRLGSMLVSTFNGQYGGSAFLAASSMCTLSEGYIMPENFKPCIVVYEYEGICLCVSFAQIGEGVVMATAQFAVPEIAELLKTDLGGIVE